MFSERKFSCFFVLLALNCALLCALGNAWDETAPLDPDHFVYARTSAGRLMGFATEPALGRRAYVFKQIPYAQPPLGHRRFRPLEAVRAWTGDRDATVYAPACLSNTSQTTSPQKSISEDCLYTNVFTDPQCFKGARKCPVLFYIHGGGFYYDSAVMFSDRQIVEKYASDGVVVVISAFRLGIFAALDVGDESVVPKNLGLNDIIFALNWTRNEIGNFGGDSRRITIMGNSGGGYIAESLLWHRSVPPTLFRRAIISSASFNAFCEPRLLSDALLKRFNCSAPFAYEPQAQADCLRYVNASDLLEAQRVLVDERGLPFCPLVPSDELPLGNLRQMLPQMKSRTLWLSSTADEFRPDREASNENSCRAALSQFGYKTYAAYDACMREYFSFNMTNSSKNFDETGTLGNFVKTDDVNAKTYDVTPRTHALHAQSLLVGIVNAHKGGKSYLSSFRLANHSNHADDLLFLLGLHWTRQPYTCEETLMDAYLPQVLKNFLKTGELESDWKPITNDGRGFFVFDYKFFNRTDEAKEKLSAAVADSDDDANVNVNSCANIHDAFNSSQPIHTRLSVWPQFEARAYDDPQGERFWLIDMAKIEADALGFDYRADGPETLSSNLTNALGKISADKTKNWKRFNKQNRSSYADDKDNIYNENDGQNKKFTEEKEVNRSHSKTRNSIAQNKNESHKEPSWWMNPWWSNNKTIRNYRKQRLQAMLRKQKEAEKRRAAKVKNVKHIESAKTTTSEPLADASTTSVESSEDFQYKIDTLKKILEKKYNKTSHNGEKKTKHRDEPLVQASSTSKESAKKFEDDSSKLNESLNKKKKKDEPLVQASSTSVEAKEDFEDNLDEIKKFLEEKKRKDEPLIKASNTSIEAKEDFEDDLDEIKKFLEEKTRKGEPLIKASNTSIEAKEKFEDDLDDLKKFLEEKKKKGEPLVEASSTSIEAMKSFNESKQEVEEILRHKKRYNEPLIESSNRSAEAMRDSKSTQIQDVIADIKDFLKKKSEKGEPIIKSSWTSIEWAVGDGADDESTTTESSRAASRTKPTHTRTSPTPTDNSESASSVSYSSTSNKLNLTYNELNCTTSDSGLNRGEQTRLNCTRRTTDFSSPTPNEKINRNDTWQNEPCFVCYPNPWWEKNEKKFSNRKTMGNYSKDAEIEPPFWLPFFDTNFVLVEPVVAQLADEKNATIGATSQLNNVDSLPTKVNLPDLSALDVAQSDSITVELTSPDPIGTDSNGAEALTSPLETEAAPSRGLYVWLAMCIVSLVVSVTLILFSTRLLYRFKNARGYTYSTPEEKYLTEKSRIVTARNGGYPKYTTN